MTTTAKYLGHDTAHWTEQAERAEADGYPLAAQLLREAATRADRLFETEHPLDEMHRPSNCEYAGMGDHSAENCPAGGV